jgi:hypothetical protein
MFYKNRAPRQGRCVTSGILDLAMQHIQINPASLLARSRRCTTFRGTKTEIWRSGHGVLKAESVFRASTPDGGKSVDASDGAIALGMGYLGKLGGRGASRGRVDPARTRCFTVRERTAGRREASLGRRVIWVTAAAEMTSSSPKAVGVCGFLAEYHHASLG